MVRTRPAPTPTWRKWLLRIHLWCGLAVGLLLAALGLSGAMLIYAPELETGVSPARGRVDGPPVETVAANVLAGRPGMRLRDVRFDRFGNAIGYHLQEAEPVPGGRDLHVLVDPAAGVELRQADRRSGVWHWLRELHHDLFAGRIGRQVNGIAAGILFVLCLTGLAVWWPGPKLWRKRLLVRRGMSWKRTVWDLHNAAGFWTCAALAFFAFTGMLLVWPEPVRRALGVRPSPELSWNLAGSEGPRATAAQLVEAAERAVRGGRVAQIKFPVRAGEPVEVRVKTPLDGHMYGHSRVWLHPRDASVLRIEDFRRLPLGRQVLAVAGQLHKGHFTDAGWPGAALRALWIPVGLAPGLLFLTGFLMWWNRVAAKKLRKRAGDRAGRARRRRQAVVAASLALLAFAGRLHGASAVAGRVVDAGGGAVAGARILLQTAPPRLAESGEDGSFRLEQIGPGLHLLRVEAEGFAPQLVWARAGESVDVRLEPAPVVTVVEVNAGAFDQVRLEEPVFQTGIARADIATRNNRRLADVVARMPGVFMSGPPGGDKDVRLRGLDKEFSRTQVDGVLIPDGGEKRELQLNRLPSSAVEAVRIIRNPTAEFESDGLAGRVDVETRPIPQRLHMEGRAGYGFRRNSMAEGIAQGQITAGGRAGRHFGFAGTFDWLDDVLLIGRQARYPNGSVETDTERQPQRSPNFFGNFGFYSEPLGDLHIKPLLLRFASAKDRLRQTHSAAEVLTSREEESEAKLQQTFGATLNHRLARRSGLVVDSQAGWFGTGEDKDRRRQRFRVAGGVATSDRQELEPESKADKTWLFSTAVSRPVRALVWQDWKLGVSWRRRGRVRDRDRLEQHPDGVQRYVGEPKDRYRLREDYVAGFLQNRIRLTDRLSWTPGVRYERVGVDAWSQAAGAGPRLFVDVNPSSHLLYRVTGSLSLRAAVSRLLARPKFDELAPYENIAAAKIVMGNPDLEPARAWAYDVGFDYVTPQVTVSVNGFKRSIRGVIEEVSTGQWRTGREVLQVQNAGDGWVRGLEFEQRFRPGRLLPRWARPFSIWANQTILRSQLHDALGRVRPFKEQPRWIANVGGDFAEEGWGTSLSVMANFVSRRYDFQPNGNVSSFGGATSVDVALYQRLRGGLRLFLEGNNLTGRDRTRDEMLAGGGLQWRRETFGRTLLGGFEISF